MTVIGVVVVLAAFGWGTSLLFAQSSGISLEQCRNGGPNSPNDCVAGLGGGSGWVSGNANHTQSHFMEGHSIPYRAIATGVPGGSQSVTLGYDIKHSGRHAIDFLTHYDRLEPHLPHNGQGAEDVVPTSGTIFEAPANDPPTPPDATCAFPKPANLTGVPGTPAANAGATFDAIEAAGEHELSIWGASSCNIVPLSAGNLAAAKSEASVRVEFDATSSTVLMAWGGHIAMFTDWGEGMSASGISGSPYHMRLLAASFTNVGNQDRSLSARAVSVFPTTIVTGVRNADNDENINSILVGESARDRATITAASGTPTGDVTFRLCGPEATVGAVDCSGDEDGVLVSTNALVDGVATSDATSALTEAGFYCFRAEYEPTPNSGFLAASHTNNLLEPLGQNECFEVQRAGSTTVTTLHLGPGAAAGDHTEVPLNSSVPAGSIMHDLATVTGVNPSGNVTFTFFENGTCAGDGTAFGTVALTSVNATTSVAHPSNDTAPLAPGNYSFRATYAGDGTNVGSTSDCEPFSVYGMSTQPFAYPQDEATLSGLAAAGGTLTFRAYESLADCTNNEDVKFTSPAIPVNATSGTWATNNTTYRVDSATTIFWRVDYSGHSVDDVMLNSPASSHCVEKMAITEVVSHNLTPVND